MKPFLALLALILLSSCTTTVRYRNGQWEVDGQANVSAQQLESLFGLSK